LHSLLSIAFDLFPRCMRAFLSRALKWRSSSSISRVLQLRLASGLKERYLSADEDQKIKAIKALHKMLSTGGAKGLNAVLQCGVVAEVSNGGLMSPNWSVRAPCAAFLMSFLTVCASEQPKNSLQRKHETLSGLLVVQANEQRTHAEPLS